MEKKIASWYSGFRTTKYLVEPNFCVALLLSEDENPNKWEQQLHVIAYNILNRLEDSDLMEYAGQIMDGVNEGYQVQEDEGYPGLFIPGESETGLEDIPEPVKESKPILSKVPETASYEAEFDELLSLAEDQSQSNQDSFFSPTPSSGGSDPFGSSGAADPFSSGSSGFGTPSSEPIPSNVSGAPESKEILMKLQNLERTMPKKPASADKDTQFNYLEKKVAFLEEKINVLSGLINTLQRKELEIKDKNEVIAKLMALLS